MNRTRTTALASLVALSMLGASLASAASQQATPAPSSAGLSIAAGGIVEPAGFTWAQDGTFYVTETTASPSMEGHATPAAMPMGALDGAVLRIANGCPTTYQGNLPSSGTPDGRDVGPAGLSFLNGQLYLLDEGGGPDRGNPLTPDGVYAIPGDGSIPLVADIHTWVGQNPVENPTDTPENSDVTGMVAHDGSLIVVESDQGQLLSIGTDGSIDRLVDLSASATQPHGIAVLPGGEILIGMDDRIISIADDGTQEEIWTELNGVIDIATTSSGTIYALQGDGTVLRTAADGPREVATGFANPGAIGIGPDGGIYVSTTPADDPHTGGIVRLDPNQGQLMTMDNTLLTDSDCIVQPTPTATAAATPDATPDAAATPDDDDASGDSQTVNISDFAFDPTSISVSAGTTVTWTNNDTVAHTVTASDGSFDSGNLAPGDSFSFTFTDSGTFDYACMYHPNMQATVVVD